MDAKPFTYQRQPDNVGAWRMGEACRLAADAPAGDYIDRGLVLLRELQAKGYGIVALSAHPEQRMGNAEKGNHVPINGLQRVAAHDVAGVSIFGSPEDVAAARAALEAKPLPAYPDELTPELREVLGWMCFQCAPIAHAMQAAGMDIQRKAEDEQAHVLHWMVKLVLRHGANWRVEGSKDINAWLEAAHAKAGS